MKEWEFEARLNAHRKLLVEVLTLLAGKPEFADALLRYKEETASVQDHQEDPGVEPDPMFAVKGKSTDELQSMLTSALIRAKVIAPSSAA